MARRWTQKEDNLLAFCNGETSIAEVARRVRRTTRAVELRMASLRLYPRGAAFSLSSLARHIGVHRRMIHQAGRMLGQKWQVNRRRGGRGQFRIDENQADAI